MVRRALAPHLAWPLSDSDLRRSLGDDFQRVRVVWTGWDKQGGEDPLSVSWPGMQGEQPAVWVRPVERHRREQLRDLLVRQALPQLAVWLQEVFSASETWQDGRHERRWSVVADNVVVDYVDGLACLDRDRGKGSRYRAPIK